MARRSLPLDSRLVLGFMRRFGATVSSRFQTAHRSGWLPDDSKVRVIHDLRYGASSRQAVDLYLPAGNFEKPHPWFVFIHGGGWVMCDRRMSASVGRVMAERGIAVVAPGYRLLPRVSRQDQRRDVARAIRYAHEHLVPHYGLDTERWAVGGESAGAHLAFRTADEWTDHKPKGLIGVYGLYDLDGINGRSPTYRSLVRAIRQDDHYRSAADDHSALRPLPWNDVPALLLHGTRDLLAPHDQSNSLAAVLREAGNPVTQQEFDGAGHGFIYNNSPGGKLVCRDGWQRMLRFLLVNGVAPKRSESTAA